MGVECGLEHSAILSQVELEIHDGQCAQLIGGLPETSDQDLYAVHVGLDGAGAEAPESQIVNKLVTE